MRWNGEKWEGDVPDGGWPPDAKHAFIMKPEGHARIFGAGLADGPFPEHYEPWESPVTNLLHPDQSISPAFKIWNSEMDSQGSRDRYPIVGTTYRVSEHWQTGAMTRNLPWLAELQPDMFVEMSRELAWEKGIENGDKVLVESARGAIEAVAVVTRRMQPFQRARAGRASGWYALALGLQGTGHRRQRQRADSACGRCQYDDPRNQGVPMRCQQNRLERRCGNV